MAQCFWSVIYVHHPGLYCGNLMRKCVWMRFEKHETLGTQGSLRWSGSVTMVRLLWPPTCAWRCPGIPSRPKRRKKCSTYLQGNYPAGSLDFESPLLGIRLAVKDRTGDVDAVQRIRILRGPRIIQLTFPLVEEEPAGFPAPDGPLATKLT